MRFLYKQVETLLLCNLNEQNVNTLSNYLENNPAELLRISRRCFTFCAIRGKSKMHLIESPSHVLLDIT